MPTSSTSSPCFRYFIIVLLLIITIATLIIAQLRSSINERSGDANPLSLGGTYFRRGETPWLCPLFIENQNGEHEYKCGTSLVTKNFVLTAAHCIQPKTKPRPQFTPHEILIYVGRFNLTNNEEPNGVIIPGKDIKIHPDWNYSTERYDADIALIEMQMDVEFSKFVERIALPSFGTSVAARSIGFVVGFGRSENEKNYEKVPRRIEIPVVGVDTCYQNHPSFNKIKSEKSFCAGKPGVIPCNGDSGSSFYTYKNKKPVILGVVSVGISGTTEKSCNDETFALIVDVTMFSEWIKQEVGGSGYLTAADDNFKEPSDNRGMMWEDKSAFCEFRDEGGYVCFLRGIHSTSSNLRITQITGNHQEDETDAQVSKMWIIDQKTSFIPELSKVVAKFPGIRDFRIWSCELRHIERSKLAIFKRIRVLDFFNNKIQEIPADAFDDLTHLEELKILKNQIRVLPPNLLHNLKNLKWFRAQENEIEILPQELFDGTQIVEVQMSQNRLRKILVDFKQLSNVNVIDFLSNECINRCLGHYCERISIDEMQNSIDVQCK